MLQKIQPPPPITLTIRGSCTRPVVVHKSSAVTQSATQTVVAVDRWTRERMHASQIYNEKYFVFFSGRQDLILAGVKQTLMKQ